MSVDLQKLKANLRVEEGVRHSVYKDSLGFLTIGVGHCVDAKKGCGIDDATIDFILGNDLSLFLSEIANEPWFIACADSEPRQRALLDMYFELRHNLLGFVRTLDALEKRDFKLAAACLRKSLWARQVPNRSARLIAMIEDGVD